MYGTAHHEKYPYQKDAADAFEKFIESIRNGADVNNSAVNFRNDVYTIIDRAYQELKMKYADGVEINPSRRLRVFQYRGDLKANKACDICSEIRAIDICHIIPRELGGSDEDGNYFYLCPTHHFLFDHARLSEEEFSCLDIKAKNEDAKAYFESVHFKRMRMYWKFKTSRFSGCSCGSEEFDKIMHPAGERVKALKCKECGEVWDTVWINNDSAPKA